MPAKSGIWVIRSAAPIRLRRRSLGNAASLKGIVDRLANQGGSDGCQSQARGRPWDTTLAGPAGFRAPTRLRTLRSKQPSSGRQNRDGFRPSWYQVASPHAQRQRPDASRSKITRWCLRYPRHYITQCSKWGKSMLCALVCHWIRFGSAGPRPQRDLNKPNNRYKGKKPVLHKRGRSPAVHTLSSGSPDPGSALAGSYSARRPSAMRRACLSPWRTAAKPTAGVGARGGRGLRPTSSFLASSFLAAGRFGRHTKSL